MNVLEEVQPALDAVDIPDPKSAHRTHGINLHKVKGRSGEDVLVAFGQVSFDLMIKAVQDYETATEAGDALHYDPVHPVSIQAVLGHLRYDRVAYTVTKGGFDLDWTQGLIPVTVWTL